MSLIITAVLALFSISHAADFPDYEKNQRAAAERMGARSEEGQYEMRASDGGIYYLTVIRANHRKVYISLTDKNLNMQKSFLYVEYDESKNKYPMAEFFDFGEGGIVFTGSLVIDDNHEADLELQFAEKSMRKLHGKKVDGLPSLRASSSPIECTQTFEAAIGLPNGETSRGEITLYPSGTSLTAFYRSNDGGVRRQFRSGDQNGETFLTSVGSRLKSFFHLRLTRREDTGEYRGYSVVTGLGRSTVPTVLIPKKVDGRKPHPLCDPQRLQ